MSTSDALASSGTEPATRVLISPIGNDAGSWQFVGLKDAHPFEYPGHGQRPRQPGWTQESFADEVLASFTGPLDLVGMSMGAAVVGHILVKHPQRVRSAVMACSGYAARSTSTSEDQAAKRQALLGRGERGVKGGMGAVIDETLTRWFTPFALKNEHPGVVYARETLLRMDTQAWNDVWLCNANSALVPVERLAGLPTPVTIIGGLMDGSGGVQGLRGLERLHELFPNSRVEIMPGPHMMHLEQPEGFAAALDRHFVWAMTGQRVEPILGSARLD